MDIGSCGNDACAQASPSVRLVRRIARVRIGPYFVPSLKIGKLRGRRAKIVVVALLATLIIALLSLMVWGGIAFFHGESDNVPALMQKMAEIVDEYRSLCRLG